MASPFYQSSGSNCPLVFVPSEFRKVYMGAVVGEGLFSETELVLMSLSTQAKKRRNASIQLNNIMLDINVLELIFH